MSESMEGKTSYWGVFKTFVRNSLVRDMTFRANFLLECISSASWTLMNVGFYLILFQHAPSIGAATGWGRSEFFIFLATTWMINSIVQTFFMPNAQEFSELIRTGGLDFALLKPIDTQFLISFRRMDWSALSNLVVAVLLLGVGIFQLSHRSDPTWQPSPWVVILYPFYLFCGVAILYSIMTVLAATSIWLGRNQSLYDFWFTSPIFHATQQRSTSGAGATRCGASSPLRFRCWWWSMCRLDCWLSLCSREPPGNCRWQRSPWLPR